MNVVQSVLFLLLGWLFGLLSPTIIDANRRRRAEVRTKLAIVTELREVRSKLVWLRFKLATHLGTVDRPLLEWIASALDEYDGVYADATFRDGLRRYLNLTDRELVADIEADRRSAPHGAVGLTSFHIPYLDAQVGQLDVFGPAERSLLMEIRIQVGILNEVTEDARFFFRKGFDSGLSADSYKAADGNLKGLYADMAEKAQHVIELIERYSGIQAGKGRAKQR